jgi:hypothetical protein
MEGASVRFGTVSAMTKSQRLGLSLSTYNCQSFSSCHAESRPGSTGMQAIETVLEKALRRPKTAVALVVMRCSEAVHCSRHCVLSPSLPLPVPGTYRIESEGGVSERGVQIRGGFGWDMSATFKEVDVDVAVD